MAATTIPDRCDHHHLVLPISAPYHHFRLTTNTYDTVASRDSDKSHPTTTTGVRNTGMVFFS
jgi:hypothetical protein